MCELCVLLLHFRSISCFAHGSRGPGLPTPAPVPHTHVTLKYTLYPTACGPARGGACPCAALARSTVHQGKSMRPLVSQCPAAARARCAYSAPHLSERAPHPDLDLHARFLFALLLPPVARPWPACRSAPALRTCSPHLGATSSPHQLAAPARRTSSPHQLAASARRTPLGS